MYVYHCHMLEHEDNEMMRPYEVMDMGGAGEAAGPNLPVEMTLGRATPNPFRGQMNIAFGLPRRQSAKLTIYNVLGGQVKTLASGELDAGQHRAAWDGTDASGSRVSAGIYMCKLVTEGDTKTGRVTLVQ